MLIGMALYRYKNHSKFNKLFENFAFESTVSTKKK